MTDKAYTKKGAYKSNTVKLQKYVNTISFKSITTERDNKS